MEKLVTIQEIYENTGAYLGQKIRVGGWLRSNRGSKSFGFLVLHDGSCFQTLQIVYGDQIENFPEISRLNVGAAVLAEGILTATPGSPAAL